MLLWSSIVVVVVIIVVVVAVFRSRTSGIGNESGKERGR